MSGRAPVLVGLTGAIAMGKTWAARVFQLAGAAVFDADAAVHALLAPGGAAVGPVAKAFPEAKNNDAIDRARLGKAVFGKATELARLEAILHPLVFAEVRAFVAIHARRGTRLVVLDVPLLFETGFDSWVDWTVAVSAPRHVQLARLRHRPGMTAERLAAIETNQLSDSLKRHLADSVVSTRATRGESLRTIFELAKVLKGEPGRMWGPGWGHE